MIFKNKGFTIPELVVTITILAILGSISFLSYSGYTRNSRDTLRYSDLNNIKISLEHFYNKTGKYPEPSSAIDITYKGAIAWSQGSFGKSTLLNVESMSNIPVDPLTGIEYTYSLLNTKKEFEIAGALEGHFSTNNIYNKTYAKDTIEGISIVIGKYNGQVLSVSTGSTSYVLAIPTVIIGDNSLIKVDDIISNKKLAYNGSNVISGNFLDSNFNMGNTFNYVPNNYIVYEGSLADLVNDENKRILLLRNLQEIYKGTNISGNSDYDKLIKLDIDILNPSINVKQLSCFFVKNNIKRMRGCTENLTTSAPVLPAATKWEYYPVDLRGLFATGSLYTNNWTSNSCDPYTMNIIDISPGVDIIPENLVSGNIYRLSAGNYRLTRGVNFDNCTSIVGIGDVNVKADVDAMSYLFRVFGKSNIIISGINLDGNFPTYSTINNLFITSAGNTNLSFNKLKSYNTGYGIRADGDNMTFNSIVTYYNGNVGLSINGTNNIIINSLSYSNLIGVSLSNSNYTTLTNIQSFNNDDGLKLSSSNNNSFSNILVYSNFAYGIRGGGSSNNDFNNLYSYNNTNNNLLNSTNNYYGIYKNYGNDNNSSSISAGIGHSIFSDGVIDLVGTFSPSVVTLPSIGGWDYNIKGPLSNETRTNFTPILTGPFNGAETYTFGEEIPNQTRPIRFNGTNPEYYGIDGNDYDTTKKIGQW